MSNGVKMGRFGANWRRTISYLRRNGFRNTCYAAAERLFCRGEEYCYEDPPEEILEAQRRRHWERKPLFSIVVPTYRTPEPYLREMADSVLCQTYDKWELVLADATEDDSVKRIVEELTTGRTGGERLRYMRLAANQGIPGNTNQALRAAEGDYVGLLDHDDVLTPDALYEMADRIEKEEKAGRRPLLLYSDEDKCNQDRSVYYEPHRKENFNLDLLLSNNYICHFLVMEKNLLQSLEFREAYNGAQDYDLVLRAAAVILPEEERIVHIPKVLYHWRCHSASTAENPQSKRYAYEAGLRAVQDFAACRKWNAKAFHKRHLGFYGLRYEPDLLTVREDVGAVGGRLLSRMGPGPWLRVAAGAMDEEGNVLYRTLPDGFSGTMHRAVLLQDVAAADLRLFRLRKECQELFQKVTGVPYVTVPSEDRFDESTLPPGTDVADLSLRLGRALREAGYRVCWDPEWSRRLWQEPRIVKMVDVWNVSQ